MTTPETVSAFTSKSNNGILRQLRTPVDVISGGNTAKVQALWDTGASATCISTDVVKLLGLTPLGKMHIRTPSGTSVVNTYMIDIKLPNNVSFVDVQVCDSEIGNQGIGVLIGMDIITKGDFAVSNYNGKTVFSFRYPSKQMTDYVAQINVQKMIGTHGNSKKKKKK